MIDESYDRAYRDGRAAFNETVTRLFAGLAHRIRKPRSATS